MTAAHRLLFLLLLLPLGCVEIRDERGAASDDTAAPGQFDTGWHGDTGPEGLPETIACVDDSSCVSWLDGRACLASRCSDGQCVAQPVPDGVACSDGSAATRGDRCASGVCQPGAEICLCDQDADCVPFDDGDGCNGRLACDGCGCVAVDTPAGTPCDDGSALTVGDKCTDQGRCEGVVPCGCQSNAECVADGCEVAACAECACRSYADVPGTAYASWGFQGALPSGFSVASTNPITGWRSTAEGVSATGPDGTYDHGAAVVTLTSPLVALPDGPVAVEVRFRLGTAECDDTLTLALGDAQLQACEAAPSSLRTFVATGGHAAAFTATFVADNDQNLGSGPLIESVRLVRLGASSCGPANSELAVTAAGALEREPDVARLSDGRWFVAYADDQGVGARELDAQGAPIGLALRLGEGTRPALSSLAIAVERGGGVLVRSFPELTNPWTLPGASRPDLEKTYCALTAAVGHAALYDLGAVLAGGSPELLEPLVTAASDFDSRVVVQDDVASLLVVAGEDVQLLQGGSTLTLLGDAPTGRPDAAVAFARIGAAWPTTAGLSVATSTGQVASLVAGGATDVALGATSAGWVVLWVEGGTLRGRQLTGTLNLDLAIDPVSAYLFGGQRAPRLAPAGERALAVWVSPWLDGDPQTVAARLLPDSFL